MKRNSKQRNNSKNKQKHIHFWSNFWSKKKLPQKITFHNYLKKNKITLKIVSVEQPKINLNS